MPIDYSAIIAANAELRSVATTIKKRARDASTDIGGIDDNKPAARALSKLDAEILRLRPAYLAAHTAFLAAIDS